MTSIIINVGGQQMQTYKSTLEKLEYFKSMFARWDNTSSNEVFIDYDPALFIHLLNKLRNDAYELPNSQNVVSMCNFFGYPIEVVEEAIEKQIEKPVNGFIRYLYTSDYSSDSYYIRDGEQLTMFAIKIITEENTEEYFYRTRSIRSIVFNCKQYRWEILISNIAIYFKNIGNNIWKLRKEFVNTIRKRVDTIIINGDGFKSSDIHIVVDTI